MESKQGKLSKEQATEKIAKKIKNIMQKGYVILVIKEYTGNQEK